MQHSCTISTSRTKGCVMSVKKSKRPGFEDCVVVTGKAMNGFLYHCRLKFKIELVAPREATHSIGSQSTKQSLLRQCFRAQVTASPRCIRWSLTRSRRWVEMPTVSIQPHTLRRVKTVTRFAQLQGLCEVHVAKAAASQRPVKRRWDHYHRSSLAL